MAKEDSAVSLQQPDVKDTLFFDNHQPFEVLSIVNAFAHSSDEDTANCKDWLLPKDQVKTIIQHGKTIHGPAWHYDFLVFCMFKICKHFTATKRVQS
ncbi:MAG: hypothetical protein H7Y86_10820 [Rhizobacter sp.]|nr:hypothetical protein [Ferruginibacter sp.]